MAYYNLTQVKAILGEIKTLNLERPDSLDNADITELQSQFNGAGSDSMPLVLRKALSKLLGLKCTVAYFKSDGTDQGQERHKIPLTLYLYPNNKRIFTTMSDSKSTPSK